MKTGNGKRVKETPSILPALHQKKKKESSGNDNSVWNDIIHCAIDNDLQCNICFEIFIKVLYYNYQRLFNMLYNNTYINLTINITNQGVC